MARSSFYYYQKRFQMKDKYAEIKEMIKQIYHRHKGRLGYRRITLLLKEKGILINHKTVLRLMKILGLKSIIRVKKYKSYKGEQGKLRPMFYRGISNRTLLIRNGQPMLQSLMYRVINFTYLQSSIYLMVKLSVLTCLKDLCLAKSSEC
jgi:transposase InsO family protein